MTTTTYFPHGNLSRAYDSILISFSFHSKCDWNAIKVATALWKSPRWAHVSNQLEEESRCPCWWWWRQLVIYESAITTDALSKLKISKTQFFSQTLLLLAQRKKKPTSRQVAQVACVTFGKKFAFSCRNIETLIGSALLRTIKPEISTPISLCLVRSLAINENTSRHLSCVYADSFMVWWNKSELLVIDKLFMTQCAVLRSQTFDVRID